MGISGRYLQGEAMFHKNLPLFESLKSLPRHKSLKPALPLARVECKAPMTAAHSQELSRSQHKQQYEILGQLGLETSRHAGLLWKAQR